MIQIKAVQIAPEVNSGSANVELVSLKVVGQVTPNDPMLGRARAVVANSGSAAMVKAFDHAVSAGLLVKK